MKQNKKYKLDWIFKYFFPGLFLFLFFSDISRRIFFPGYFGISTLYELFMFLLELYFLYIMLYFLTVEYEFNENNLIVHSFLFRKKIYNIKDIMRIRDEGGYYLFKKIPFGINAIILDLKNGKDLPIIGLKEHFHFLQKLQSLKQLN